MTKALLLAAFLFPVLLRAGTVTLAWDTSPAAEQIIRYSVYEQTAPNVWTKLTDATSPTATLLNVTAGVHTYAVSASNIWLESPMSIPVTTPPAPSAPSNLRVITITVQ